MNPNVPEPLAVLTTKLLAKDPEDRYASAAELSDDLQRVRSGLSLVAADTQNTETSTVPLPPLPLGRSERTSRTAIQPPPVATASEDPERPRRRRGRLLTSLLALLVIAILLGGLIWALAQGGDDLPGAENAQDSTVVRIPDLRYAETAESDLAAAGLRLGRRDEAPSDTVPVGVVSEQDPVEGTEAEAGTTVAIVVSTGPQQIPVYKKQTQEDEKQRERQRQEEEKQREKQQQEKEKQREKQQQEEEKRREKGE
jgi:serine/threonine-protein kinase